YDSLRVLALVDDVRDADIVLTARLPSCREACQAGRGPLGHVTGSIGERWDGRKLCGAVRCRHNLSTVLASERPGRRGPGVSPTDTIEVFEGGGSNCSLDYTEVNGPMQAAEIGRALSMSKRRVQQIA